MSIHSIYRLIFRIWRAKRFEWFVQKVCPSKSDTLLDVGGYPWFWTSRPQPVASIDTVNVHDVQWPRNEFPDHNIRTLIGDGCALKLPDRSYDIGFSNSVIEHVGSWERQQQFASEIRRVAAAVWVQTPAYECPFEPHFLAPCVHYLPLPIRKPVVRWFTPWGWIAKPSKREADEMVETTRLLKWSEMRTLFPDCEIIVERLLGGIPKSYIAYRAREGSARVDEDCV